MERNTYHFVLCNIVGSKIRRYYETSNPVEKSGDLNTNPSRPKMTNPGNWIQDVFSNWSYVKNHRCVNSVVMVTEYYMRIRKWWYIEGPRPSNRLKWIGLIYMCVTLFSTVLQFYLTDRLLTDPYRLGSVVAGPPLRVRQVRLRSSG